MNMQRWDGVIVLVFLPFSGYVFSQKHVFSSSDLNFISAVLASVKSQHRGPVDVGAA